MRDYNRLDKQSVNQEYLLTLSGRKIPHPPPIRLESERKAKNDLRKIDLWLLEQARAEAVSRLDEWNKMTFGFMSVKNLSPADRDTLNQYLFGREDAYS